ncbi:MAG: CDP-glycerol glycerophosphotransferase family protein [Clostridia bacterium]|nr:CDP-glycerol glycerophosphotransferase family protein [Clostridia bacterium]
MILQKLLFPKAEVCTREPMYYNGEGITCFLEEEHCVIPKGSTLLSNTYFNSFSAGKWLKYTRLNNLQLRVVVQGEFSFTVHHTYKMVDQMKDNIIAEKRISAPEKTEVILPVPLGDAMGLYYFSLTALSEDATYWGGAYETEAAESERMDTKIAIGICTFRREAYITHNIQILEREILNNPESPMYGKLELYISDNSKTLPAELNTDAVHIFPNRNLGGAGGFTRAMIEIKNVSDEKGFTHILLMDDDVRLNPDSLLRTHAMLQLLKPEHKGAFIGGHMLKIDTPYIQSEAADHWDIASHHPVKYNYNLEKLDFLIKNEIEDSVNYLSWWYCCMPVNVVTDSNLPLPIFIKRDDIEYGLRNGQKFITLNGVCVWHEPFEYKYSTYLEYYYFRNLCIMNSRHRLSFDKNRLIDELRRRVFGHVSRYRYKDAEVALLGVQHYLKGIDWLKAQDAEKLNAEIMALGYKKEPLENLDFVFIHGAYEGALRRKPGKNDKRNAILNWILPAKRTAVVPAYQPQVSLFYRAKKVLNYEEVTNTGFITEHDRRSMLYILRMYRKTVRLIRKKYKRVTQEYRDRYNELTNIGFWKKYLFTPGEAEKVTSNLDKPRRPKNTKQQKKEMLVSLVLRFVQLLLFWLPVKKKRVMVYIHDRNGFTCNPKYIVKKLVEEYGKQLEIIWCTMHPETCKEVQDLGVRVVKSNTLTQARLYLRSRMFITNDAFPSWALKRWGQKWMNTWHGAMNYKHIGYDYLAPMSRIAARLFKIRNRQPDYFLSGSRFFTEDTSVSFRLSDKVFVASGLPRNDVLFGEHPEICAKVRKFYHLDDKVKLAMFAPTFRRGMKSDTFGMDFDVVRNALSKRFGGEWVILFRNHNFVKGKQSYGGAVDVSGYHDMQELMCAADVLISDYSSCLYDFCMTGKPSFVYATDLYSYMNNDRSFAYAFEKWPYPFASTNEELEEQIKNFDEKDFAKKVKAHLQDVGAYDNGTASQQMADLIGRLTGVKKKNS